MSTLVAGIGNIFLGDDGFGCEVARRLQRQRLPAGVDVADFGIRGMDLGYAILDGGYQNVVLIDTAERGSAPGTVYVIEPEIDDSQVDVVGSGEQLIAPHEMDPAKVLRLIASLGERRPRVLLVACEPEYLGGEAGHMGLSEAVAAAVEPATCEVRSAIDAWPAGGPRPTGAIPADDTTAQEQAAPGGML